MRNRKYDPQKGREHYLKTAERQRAYSRRYYREYTKQGKRKKDTKINNMTSREIRARFLSAIKILEYWNIGVYDLGKKFQFNREVLGGNGKKQINPA